MGAATFTSIGRGATAKEAFRDAVESAAWYHGHGGYTGTIAEKHEFTMIAPNPGETPEECAQRLIDADDPRISDKWGPAGCIALGEGEFLFFGWASS